MITKQELIQGYENEIAYQKHMIDNLGRWFSLLFLIASIGSLVIYFFHQKSLIWTLIGGVLMLVGILGMLLFGYGIYKGQKNVKKVIEDLERRLSHD